MITFGSLFAGIGGLDLGLERAGMTCKWQVEIDDYATRVLAKHWPDVRRWRDVRTFGSDAEPVDVICGGFPCTNISSSGDCTGLAGQASGLWFEMLRIIRKLEPRYIIVENVSDIVHRGLGDVLGGLSSSGYDAEWQTLPAALFGAPQRRTRIFIVAYRDSSRFSRGEEYNQSLSEWPGIVMQREESRHYVNRLAAAEHKAATAASRICGMDDAVSNRVDRLRGLGNAVVPQVAEWVGRQIVDAVKRGKR